ncbi:MAG: hypothetical protein H0T60_18615 [Acidobacteria bacterium]|nr:hypothetical protein [Acidobacteriota bacterium]
MPFVKGQSGHPGGRSQEKIFADQLRLVVNETVDKNGTKKIRKLADKLVERALEGEGWALQQVADRLDGKPTQMLAGDPDGSPIRVERIEIVAPQLLKALNDHSAD